CARVAADGDAALREYAIRFDGWAPTEAGSFQVPPADVAAASKRLSARDRSALEFAAQRIRDFHRAQVQPTSTGSPGMKLLPHAVAALAYGTATVPRVDVLVGPGNIYVTLAKREVFGAVGLDGIAGPTEVLIVADEGARPDFVAADLAAQLEHDPLAWAVLVTDSSRLADRVEEELSSLVAGLERAEIINAAACCIVVAD